jgi:hypothetical protein
VAALAAIALGCGPIPGGALSGEAAPAPATWSEALGGERAMCEIEARPSRPHSIQLECFTRSGELFVQSHRWALARWWPESWAKVWLAEPDVRVRIAGRLYALRAERISDEALRAALLKERGYDPVPPGIVVFRFAPRAPVAASDRSVHAPGSGAP